MSNSVVDDAAQAFDLGKAILQYVSRSVSPTEHLATIVTTALREGMSNVSANECDAVVTKVMDSFKAYCESEQGQKLVDQLVLKAVAHASQEIKTVVLKSGLLQTQTKAQNIARTLAQGITYHQITKNRAVFIGMFGFILADIFSWNQMTMGICMDILIALYNRMVPEQPNSLSVEGPVDKSTMVKDTLIPLWEMVCGVFGVSYKYPLVLMSAAVDAFNFVTQRPGSPEKPTYSFFGAVCKVLHQMYVWIMDKLYGVRSFSRLLYQDNRVMKTWASEAMTVVDPRNEHLVLDNDAWYARLTSCYTVGQYLMTEVSRAGVKDVPPAMMQAQKEVHRVFCKALNLGICTAFRPEPVCIWFHGEPGMGKTFNKEVLIQQLLKVANIPTTGNDVFSVNFSQKHWTGAENKAVVYYDDFGTVDDQTATPEAIGQFMQLISDSRFSPPQASVEDKGKPIRPRLVYVNANERAPPFPCIRNMVAFKRRRHICVSVVKSDEFKRVFGPEANLETRGAKKWLSEHKTEEDPTPHARYCFYDPITSADIGASLDFKAFSTLLCSEFSQRSDESYRKYVEKMKNCVDMATVTSSSPLVEVLAEIEKRVSAASSDSESAREIFGSIYHSLLSWSGGCMDLAKDWISNITGWKPEVNVQGPTDEEVVCSCHRTVDYHLYCQDGKLLYNGMQGRMDGEEFVYDCASPLCVLRDPSVIDRYKRLACMVNSFEADMYKVLSETISATPISWPVSRVKEDLVKTVADFSSQTQGLPDKVEWPEGVKMVSKFLGGMAIGLILVAGYKTFQLWKSGPKPSSAPSPRDCVVGQILSSGDSHTSRLQTKRVGITRKSFVGQSAEDRPALDVQSSEGFVSIVDNAIGFLVLSGVDRASQRAVIGFPFRVFRLRGRWIIMPKHYMSKIERTEQVRFDFMSSCGTAVVRDVKFEHQMRLESSELMFVELSSNVPNARDVVKHFMTLNDSARLTNSGQVYEKILTKAPVIHHLTLSIMNNVHYKDGDGEFVLPCSLEYAWQGSGRCMSPIVSSFGSPKIVGFHVAGGDLAVGGSGKPVGCAEPIVRETLEELPQVMVSQCPLTVEGFSGASSPALDLDMNALYLGTVADKYAARPSDKTRIVPTEIHGYVEPKTRPAPQKPADVEYKFSPLKTGVEKNGKPPLRFNPKLVEAAKEALLQQYISACKPVRQEVGVLSVNEAVLGFPGLDGYQAMELSTSEGYPYTATRPPGESNKRYLFDINDERTEVTLAPQVVENMRVKENMRSKGIVPLTVFTDCLKDARIPTSKYYVPGKTRIFSISPVDYTIQFRQYFLDLLAAQKVNRLDLEHAVGINVHSFEWTQLAKRVTAKGTNMLCGDYSNFGPGLSDQIVEAVIDVWVRWYSYWEIKQGVAPCEVARRADVRRCLLEELRHSVHLCQNILYQALCGSPSGAPCTVNLNNDVNKLYVYMAWIHLFKKLNNPIRATIVSFRQHVALYVYGDDLIAGVSDEVIGVFNNQYLQQFLAEHGVVYTDETKSGEVRKFVSFEEAGFLKGRWRPHDTRAHVFTYAQDPKSTEDVANWCMKSIDNIAATKQACCDSLMLSYGQGREYFEMHRQRLLDAWVENKCPGELMLYTFDEMEDMRFGWADVVDDTVDFDTLVEREKAWKVRHDEMLRAACGMQLLSLGEE